MVDFLLYSGEGKDNADQGGLQCPKADEEVGVMLLEPKGVVNTGDSEREDLRVAPKAMEGV